MLSAEFAAIRRERLTRADDELRGVVADALLKYDNGDPAWKAEILDAAAQLWLEHFEAEAPGRSFERPIARFRTRLDASLDKTAEPDGAVTDGQIDRVTKWISSFTVNDGTVTGAFGRGITHKRWVTMHDDSVREIHDLVDGQIVPIGGAFNVGGTKLGYPGEPVGPPEVWINCRCLAQPAARDGEAMSLATHTIGPDDEVEIDNPNILTSDDVFAVVEAEPEVVDDSEIPVDEPEDDEELLVEIPIHGVATVIGKWTGDRRFFQVAGETNDGVTWRDLPLPFRYVDVDMGGHDGAVVTGRLDNIWLENDEVRYDGAAVVTRPKASEMIDGIISGTVRGVSVDVDDVVVDGRATEAAMAEAMTEFESTGYMQQEPTVYAAVRIAGLTAVAIPAFQEGWVALGSWAEADEVDAALAACGCLQADTLEDAGEEYREIPADQRKKDAGEGKALPDGSFPIENVEDLRNAIQAIGRAKDPAAAKAHIKKRARALGHPELIPETWGIKAIVGEHGPEEVIPLGQFAPGTRDGPGWITHPIPTQRIRNYWTKGAGAAKIRWGVGGDFNRCRSQLAKYVKNPDWLAGLCANMHKEALGFWPAQHKSGKHSLEGVEGERAPGMVLTAAGGTRTLYKSEYFARPKDEGRAFPQRIDRATRQIYGYLAEWGVCHIGIAGACIEPPPSSNNYAYFLKGVVDTDAGEQRVGTLTYGIGHANERMRAAAATAHYDKTDAVRAYVNMGEDEYGIWFAGVLAPWVTDDDIDELRAIGSLSGDWRDWGNTQLDLIAAVSVNTPGFQLAASGGRQISLIAAGRIAPEEPAALIASGSLDPETVGAIARTAVAEYRHQERVEAKLAPVRDKIKSRKLALAREKMKG